MCVLSDQFFSFIPVNFLYIPFFIPALLLSVSYGLQVVSLFEAGNPMEAVRTGNMWAFLMVPCLTFTGPAKAAMTLLMKQWSEERFPPIGKTLWKGVRENWKNAFAASFLYSLSIPVLWYNIVVLLTSGSSTFGIVLFVLLCLALTLLLLSAIALFPSMVTYELSLKQHMKNALILTMLRLPQFLLVLAASLFFVLLYILMVFIRPEMRVALLIIPVLYYFMIGGAMQEFIFASFSNALFERYFGNNYAGDIQKT